MAPSKQREILFLSTPSARRATSVSPQEPTVQPYFYPRPPRGGRPGVVFSSATSMIFLSTPSARRATDISRSDARKIIQISIHALREEGDATSSTATTARSNFYPRPPRGGRPYLLLTSTRPQNFYPRPPRGGRPRPCPCSLTVSDFYPRPPRGGRQLLQGFQHPHIPISIHALREEGDLCGIFLVPFCAISIHALREEGDKEK